VKRKVRGKFGPRVHAGAVLAAARGDPASTASADAQVIT